MKKILVPVTAAAMLAAACGSSGPPSAHGLAAKIPGCNGITQVTPAVMEVQEVTCTLRDGSGVEIGTFANSAAERRWISDGGSPASPDSLYAGCCVQGVGWAATVGYPNRNDDPVGDDFRPVVSAIGGREVSG